MPPWRAAFSLVEVLVTVAIMALLAAVLLPSLSHARARAAAVTCAANLRTWGQGFHLYANDYGGTLPHIDDRARNHNPDAFDATYPERESCYIDVVPPLFRRRPWRDFSDGDKPTNDIWQCPMARPLPDSAYSPQYRPSVKGYHSFAMNSYLEQNFLFGLQPGQQTQPPFLQLNRCQAPAKTILMFDQTLDPAQGYGQGGGLTLAGRYTAEDARALAERHARIRQGLGANVIMIDTHLEWRNDLWDKSLGSPRIPVRGDLTWYPYPY